MKSTSKKVLLLASLSHAMFFATYAQNIALKTGQAVPDLQITNLHNSRQPKINLGQFKGKFIVLDFWTTWCGGCINGLRRIDSLQRKFSNDIVFLPVNYQSKATVAKFWNNNAITKTLSIFTITNDKALGELFPHQEVPYEIWIDRNGNFLNKTELEYVNESEIQLLIAGKAPNWVPAGAKSKHNFSEGILQIEKDANPSKNFYSVFKGNIPSEKTDAKRFIDSLSCTIRVTAINHSIGSLYWLSLFDKPELRTKKRFLIDIKDKSKLYYDKTKGYRGEWNIHNTYCYELLWPFYENTKMSYPAEKMRFDLNSYFQLKGRICDSTCHYYDFIELESDNKKTEKSKEEGQISLTNLLDVWEGDPMFPITITQIKGTDQIMLPRILIEIKDVSELKVRLRRLGFELKEKTERLAFFRLSAID